MSDNYLPPPKRSAAYGRQNEKSKKSGRVSKYKNSIRSFDEKITSRYRRYENSHRVIFSLRESDIETFGFSDIIFALNCPKGNIT